MTNNRISIKNLEYKVGQKINFILKIKDFKLNKSDSVLIYGRLGKEMPYVILFFSLFLAICFRSRKL